MSTDDPRTFNVGDPIPYVLTKAQLVAITGYSVWQIDEFRKTHSHPGIKELDGPGHPRFCGRALKEWADGRVVEPSGRKFFGAARRANVD